MGPGWQLRDDQPALGDLGEDPVVAAGIGHVDAAGEHGDGGGVRPGCGEQRAPMGCNVDPVRPAAHDRPAAGSQRV